MTRLTISSSLSSSLSSCLRCIIAGACLLLFSTLLSAATPYEFSRDIAELNFASERMARELRSSLGYGTLRASAERLSADAEELQESITQGRSHVYIRLQIDDLRRRYQDLQVAAAKATSGSAIDDADETARQIVSRHMETISTLYDSLNPSPYYNIQDPAENAFFYPGQGSPVIVVPRDEAGGAVSAAGEAYLRDEVRRWIETGRALSPRTPAEIRQQERAFGEVTGIQQDYDHRSSVLDRQARQLQQEMLQDSQ